MAEATSQGTVPRQHTLQAYLTVFSGWATITFALDKDQEYTLDLYDLNGTRMREIGKGRAQGADCMSSLLTEMDWQKGFTSFGF